MKVLVACEYTGIVRESFRQNGHDATSCDLLPTEIPGKHIQGNVLEILDLGWDLMIAHPPCTRLCNSGVRWLHERGLWKDLEKSAQFFRSLLDAPINRIAVENPTMHSYATALIGRGPDFCIHPWNFGDLESKRTCFWTKNLWPLVPTVFERPSGVRDSIFRTPPSPDRWKTRSRTFKGVARAMADQWGNDIYALS